MKKLSDALWRLAMSSVLFLLVLLPGRPAEAAGVVGTGTAASCTETALNTALAGFGAVTFNCGAAPVIIVLTSQKAITQNTTIDGGGMITLNGNGSTSLFSVATGVSLGLSHLTLIDGNAGVAGQGGAILNNGQLTITNCTLSNNIAPGGQGAAIYNTGVATITGSTFAANAANGLGAGAINNQNTGTLTIDKSTFSGNSAGFGGAISSIGTTSISNSSFENNQSANGGGAINNFGPLTITSSTFLTNTVSPAAGGAIYNSNTMTVTASTFSNNSASGGGGAINNVKTATITASSLLNNSVGTGNFGGAIFNNQFATLTVSTSTIAGNSAPGGLGGGIYSNDQVTLNADTFSGNTGGSGIYIDLFGSLTVINSTFSGNSGGAAGGGIQAVGIVTVTNSTLAANAPSGLVNSGTRTVSALNTIVANSTSNNCSGTITSLGHNLDSANACAFAAAGDLPNTNPLLGPLANNGGPTLTQALLPGSPAINAGTNVGCPVTDQRGIPRPQFGTCDVGAYEFVIRLDLPVVFR